MTNGVLNGADLQTSIFGTVAIPGILTDTTLLSEEGPGPIALPIQLVQFVRGLLTPPEADASSLSQGLQQNSVLPGGSGPVTTGKPTRTADPKAEDTGNVLNADKVTNAGSEEPSTGKKARPRPFGDNTTASQIGRDAARPKNLREGVRDGIQGFRDGVRDAVKTFAGRGDNDDAGNHADDTNETP